MQKSDTEASRTRLAGAAGAAGADGADGANGAAGADGADGADRPDISVPAGAVRISRRTVLNGLAVSMAMPLLPLSFLEGCAAIDSGDPLLSAKSAHSQFQSPIPQPVPIAAQTVVTATISTPAGTIPDYFMGLSYEKGAFATEPLFTGANTSLAGLFNRLGNGVLSLGGDSLDRTLWTPGGLGNTSGEVSPVDVDQLADFLALTNWKVLYGVNLATSTPALAAEEAAYVQSKLGHVLLGFAIGNEPDEYFYNYYPNGWNITIFKQLWEEYRTAIHNAAPAAIITGPASAGNVSTWTVPFLHGPNGKLVSLLTQHYYRGNGHSVNATAAHLVAPDPQIVSDCFALEAASSQRGIPFRISETNSYLYGGSPGVSNAYASALWVIDHLFNIALGGSSGVNMHGGDVGYYTPIANCGSTIVEARPEYYGLLLFSMAGQGALMQTTLSNADLRATIYTVVARDGTLNIVIVNKEPYQSLRITVDCGRDVTGADLLELRGTTLNATTGQTLQGATVATDGSITLGMPYAPEEISSASVTCYVANDSAVLLRVY